MIENYIKFGIVLLTIYFFIYVIKQFITFSKEEIKKEINMNEDNFKNEM